MRTVCAILLLLGFSLVSAAEKEFEFAIIEEHIFTWSGQETYLALQGGKITKDKPVNSPFLYFTKFKDKWYLVLEDLHNYHVPREKTKKVWETMKPAEIAEHPGVAAIPAERTGFYSLEAKDNPQVVLIPTWGLLQIKKANVVNGQPSVVLQVKRLVAAGSVRDRSL